MSPASKFLIIATAFMMVLVYSNVNCVPVEVNEELPEEPVYEEVDAFGDREVSIFINCQFDFIRKTDLRALNKDLVDYEVTYHGARGEIKEALASLYEDLMGLYKNYDTGTNIRIKVISLHNQELCIAIYENGKVEFF